MAVYIDGKRVFCDVIFDDNQYITLVVPDRITIKQYINIQTEFLSGNVELIEFEKLPVRLTKLKYELKV